MSIKYFIRITVVLLSTLLVFLSTGCESSAEDHIEEIPEEIPEPVIVFQPDDVFVPEFTSLSALAGDLPNISNIIATENALYLTSTNDIRTDQFFQATNIFTIDQTRGVLSYLPNYSAAKPPPGAEGGLMQITAMQIDPEGNIWAVEMNRYYTFDFPVDFDVNGAELDEILKYQNLLIDFYFIRKLNSTGEEMISIDITSLLLSVQERTDIFVLYVDSDESIFVGTDQTIFVLDTGGGIQSIFNTGNPIYKNSLIRLSDGRVAYCIRDDNRHIQALQEIDIQNKTWGAIIDLPVNTQDVFHGFNDYLVIINDGMNLTAISKETGEEIIILSWIDSGIFPTGLDNVLLLPDRRIMFTTIVREYDETGLISLHTELMILNRTLRDEVIDKTVLSLASFMPHLLDPAVTEFNRTNASYHIEIIGLDIDEWTESINDLLSEILAGNGPDMIHTSSLPVFDQWAQQELFVDLYDLIDTDPVLDRSGFIESVLYSLEADGKLFQMAPGFSIKTMIGFPGAAGTVRGWDIDEFKAVIEANPQATLPMGQYYNGLNILLFIVSNNINSFIDRETGTVYFDTDSFIDLLELVYTVQSKINRSNINVSDSIPHSMIISGEQILEVVSLSRFEEYTTFEDLFGGDFIFKGFPAETGSGNFLETNYGIAITTAGEHADGAWEFLRLLLSEGWQRQTMINKNTVTHYIPTNKTVLEEKLAGAMVGFTNPEVIYGDIVTLARPLTRVNVNNIRDLIDSVSNTPAQPDVPLLDILTEVMQDYFSDDITAHEAASIIQNRVSVYIAKQN